MNYEALLPYVLPYVGNCPRITAVAHIRMAAIEFFDRSSVWHDELSDSTTAIGTTSYALQLPAQTALVKLIAVDIGTAKDVPIYPYEDAKKLVANQSTSTFAWTPDKVNLKVNPSPGAAGDVIKVQAVLKPSLASTSIPDALGEQHGRDIAHGAVASLLRMPKVDWRDVEAAVDEQALFMDCISGASQEKSKGSAVNKPRRMVRLY